MPTRAPHFYAMTPQDAPHASGCVRVTASKRRQRQTFGFVANTKFFNRGHIDLLPWHAKAIGPRVMVKRVGRYTENGGDLVKPEAIRSHLSNLGARGDGRSTPSCSALLAGATEPAQQLRHRRSLVRNRRSDLSDEQRYMCRATNGQVANRFARCGSAGLVSSRRDAKYAQMPNAIGDNRRLGVRECQRLIAPRSVSLSVKKRTEPPSTVFNRYHICSLPQPRLALTLTVTV